MVVCARRKLLPLLGLVVVVMMIGTEPSADDGQVPLFDFTSQASASGWQAVNDGVMGGISVGRFRITPEQTLEFSGTLSLENNGGFASVRSIPRDLGLMPGDTLAVRVRGDGRQYQLNLYTPVRGRAFSYRASFDTVNGAWVEIRIPLDRFVATSFGEPISGATPVDPSRVTSIGFLLSEKTPGPFTLEVAWIRVIR